MSVCAGIILYNPDIKRLTQCIEAIEHQVASLVLVDNASDNISEVEEILAGSSFVLIKNDSNHGIAYALNQLVAHASDNGFEWIVTLDQDSICCESLVSKQLAAIENQEKIAMASPVIIDRGISELEEKNDEKLPEIEDVTFCITSGCLTNVSAVQSIGGFNEWLFIDEVDREVSLRLLRAGYRLVRVNTVELQHEYGLKTVTRRILWKKVVYRNYSPFHVYYQTRNLVYMLRKYGSEYVPVPFLRWFRMFFATCLKLIFEPDRLRRLKAFKKGLTEGLAVKIDKNER